MADKVKRWFGTDGIRGRVGQGPISADFLLKLGWAAGRVLARHGHANVVIGKDTRISGYMFESALEAGLVATGANVHLLGPMPTPGVAFLTRSLRADAGIVISASHNPHHDNGVKFFDGAGEKLSDELELAIERELDQAFATVDSGSLGKAIRVDGAAARYAEYCKASVPAALALDGLSLVLDCANGANYQIAPKVFGELGARIEAIGVTPDGLNINLDCGSTHLDALRARVLASDADLGIAFDGDGDRVQMVAPDGSIVDGDDLLWLLARDRRERDALQGPVVGTLMSNFGLERALAGIGVPLLRSNVGDRYVHRLLREQGGVLGGETSGHLLILDRSPTGDGIVSALQALEVLVRRGQSLAQRLEGMAKVPQHTVNLPLAPGSRPEQSPAVAVTLAECRRELEGRGRVVLRPSGTEPVIRITVECEDEQQLASVQQRLVDALGSG